MRLGSLCTVLCLLAVCLAPGAAYASGKVSITPTPSAQTNGEVDAIAIGNGVAYIGGEFTTVRPAGAATGGVARAGLAAIDLTTGTVLPWNPGITGPRPRVTALALAPDGGQVYVGGTFATLGGAPRANLGAVTTAGTVTSWNPGADGVVRVLLASAARLYVGGNFATLAGQPRGRLGAFDLPDGALDPVWLPTSPLIVKSMAFANDGSGRVFAGGGNEAEGIFQALDPLSGVPSPWLDQPEAVVDSMAVMGSQVFLAVGGNGGRVEGFDEATGGRRWTAITDGDVQAITARDGLVYAGGHYDNYCIGGTGHDAPLVCDDPLRREKLLALRAPDGSIDDWNPDTNGVLGVFSLAVTPAGIAAGGQFTRWNVRSPAPVDQQGFALLGPSAAAADITPPPSPSDVLATTPTMTEADLSWLPSVDELGGSGIDHYVVTRDGTTSFTTTATAFTDTGVLPGSTHTYTVSAVDYAGNASLPSASVTVTTPIP